MIKVKIKKPIFQKGNFSILSGVFEKREGLPEDLVDLPELFSLKGENLPASGEIVLKKYKIDVYKGEKGVCVKEFEELKSKEKIVLSFLKGIDQIGPKKAESIYRSFGDEVLNMVLTHSDRAKLLEAKGITLRIINSIESFVLEEAEKVSLFVNLNKSIDIDYKETEKLFRKFGENTLSLLEENPYAFVPALGFSKSDAIAMGKGFAKNAKERIQAGAVYLLNTIGSQSGDMYIPKENFLEKLNLFFQKRTRFPVLITEKECKENMNLLFKEKKIYAAESMGRILVYSPKYWDAENSLAREVLRLTEGKRETKSLSKAIKRKEKNINVFLSEEQSRAVEEALLNPITIISGGPGTGKTTIVNFIYNIYVDEFRGDVLLCAPTGRAARKMSEATKSKAVTINSALGIVPAEDSEEGVMIQDGDISGYSLIIVDEMSMLDSFLGEKLFRSIANGTKVVLIGDVDQLPSVGPGFVLSELIESKKVPTIKLKKIYRQADDSLIPFNAKSIKEGKKDLRYNGSFSFIPCKNGSKEAVQKGIELFLKEAHTYGMDEVALLSPFRQGPTGAVQINELIRNRLDNKKKPSRVIDGRVFREGDKVMQTKNRHFEILNKEGEVIRKEFISNGDIGYIKSINSFSSETIIDFGDERVVSMTDTDMKDIVLAYAMSIHKSQGSEYNSVIILLSKEHDRLLMRNLIYTAVTRAKKRVFIVGDDFALNLSIQRGIDQAGRRKTSLSRIMKNLKKGKAA